MSRVIRLNKHVVHLVLTYCFVSFSRILKVTQLCIMQHLGEWQIQGLLTNLSPSQYVTNLLSSPRFCIYLLLHGARNCVLFKPRNLKNKYHFIYVALFLSLSNSALQRLNKTYSAWKSQLAGGRPVGYLHSAAKELNSGRPRTNPTHGGVEDLNPGPPDYKSSTLTT